MSRMIIVPSAGTGASAGLSSALDSTLKTFGLRLDPATAPSQGLQVHGSDYAAYLTALCAGIALGSVAAYETVKLGKDIFRG